MKKSEGIELYNRDSEIKIEVVEDLIEDLNSLVNLPEFKKAWENEFGSRIAHNFHNRAENKEAALLVTEILKCQDLYNLQVPNGLASLAKSNKSQDFRWSLFSDILRASFAMGLILVNEYYEKDKVIHPILKYAPIITQLSLMLKTSFHGYQASITRHLSEELTNSFCKVVGDFITDSERINPNINSPSSQSKTPNNHNHSFASLPRNLGTTLNLLSMASNLPRLMIEYFPEAIPELKFNQNAGSYFAIIGGIISSSGKFSSHYAANSNFEIVRSKMQEASDIFSSKNITITKSQAKEILNDMSLNYENNTPEPGFLLKFLKLPVNFTKDSFYGLSYKIYNRFFNYKSKIETKSLEIQSLPASPICSDDLMLIPADFAFKDEATSSKANPLDHIRQQKNQLTPSNILEPKESNPVLTKNLISVAVESV